MRRFRLFPVHHWQPRPVRLHRGLWASLLAAIACCAGRGTATAQEQRAMLIPVGHAGGVNGSKAVEVVGDRAYLASGDAGLAVFDLSDPAVPRLLGSLDTPGSARAVHVVGSTAYVADGDAGLQIIDVANPAAPVRLGGLDTPDIARAVQVVDGIAFVADQTSGLQVISVTNSAAPVLLGGRDTRDWAIAVQVVGNYAYVVDDTTGLIVMDVSNPAAPMPRRTMTVQGWITDLQVVGNQCFVTSRDGLTVFDVSTTASPVRTSFISHPEGYESISVSGQHATVSRRNGGLDVFDVSDPAAPRQLLLEPGNRAVQGLQAVGPRLFSTDAAGLWIEDLRLGLTQTFGLSPLLEGDVIALNVPIPLPATASSGLPVSVQVTGPALLDAGVLTVTNHGAVSLVLAQAGNPEFLPAREERRFNIPQARFTRVGGLTIGNDAYKVQVVGDLAYVANSQGGVKVINVSNPAAPVLVGAFDTGVFATGAVAQNVAVVGDRAYVAAAEEGLVILDVSNPAAPSSVGTYNTTGVAYAVQVAGNLAYVADSHAGLQIIDVTDGANPVRVGGFDTPGEALFVQVVDKVAYVADAASGVQLIDVTNPATPSRLGGNNTPGVAYAVRVVGNLAYVADGPTGFQVLDLSDPLSPSVVSTTPGVRAVGISVVDQLAYVPDAGLLGLLVYDVSNPAKPVLLGQVGSDTKVYGAQVVGNRIFLANGEAGLQIFEVHLVQPQSLTWNPPATLAFTGQPLVLDATSTSGLPVTYSVLSGPATVQGNQLTVTGPGRVTIRVSQAGDFAYASATVDQTVTIGLPRMDAQTAGPAQEVSWAAGLNGLRLQGRESLAVETPWQQVTLPWVEGNGQIRVNVETSPFRFFRLQGLSGQVEPLELTGWNRDVVLENAIPSRALAFSSYGSAWFESGLGGRLDGLPANRTFLSRVTPEVLFQFQPYTGFNTLWLNNTRRSNSLVLVTPSAYSKLFVLAHSAGGGGNGTLRVHYADGTSSAPMPFFAPDWWDGSPSSPTRRPAIQGLAWSTTVASFTYDQRPPGFSFHQTDIDLGTGPNAGKVITRLEFVKPATPEVTGIYAVSGIEVAPAP